MLTASAAEGAMQRSTDRFLTTHTGSLPRPDDLIRMMYAKEEGVPVDPAALAARVRAAVAEVVEKQVAAGLDIVNDGEMSKPSYATYVKDRLAGFGGTGNTFVYQDLADFPVLAKRVFGDPGRSRRKTPACNAPIGVRDPQAARADADNLTAALEAARKDSVRPRASGDPDSSQGKTGQAALDSRLRGNKRMEGSARPAQSEKRPVDAFMSAASPGVVSLFFRNDHYPSQEAYLYAIADAMRHEYETIAAAGFVLQIDCPDLAMGRHIQYADLSLAEFRKRAHMHVEALNHALANIPPERLRIHLCWGNYEGPHHYDVPLADIIDIVFQARPGAISFEAANPRHAHEWALFERVKLPEGRTLIPGVIESKTNFIEHPELIAQRIARYANLVGRENVIAGSDCGYGTWVGQAAVDPDVVFAKMSAMAEGARLASRQFWK
jgi:5-methyltetrahydropteroyltriglutamate--homocysteine methyltransferase